MVHRDVRRGIKARRSTVVYWYKERAAKLIAIGESIEAVAKTIQKSEETVKLWLLEPDFCQLLRENVSGAALRIIVGYLTGENHDKDKAMVALALLRMNKAAPAAVGAAVKRREGEDETDLDEFSEDQIRRLTGDA